MIKYFLTFLFVFFLFPQVAFASVTNWIAPISVSGWSNCSTLSYIQTDDTLACPLNSVVGAIFPAPGLSGSITQIEVQVTGWGDAVNTSTYFDHIRNFSQTLTYANSQSAFVWTGTSNATQLVLSRSVTPLVSVSQSDQVRVQLRYDNVNASRIDQVLIRYTYDDEPTPTPEPTITPTPEPTAIPTPTPIPTTPPTGEYWSDWYTPAVNMDGSCALGNLSEADNFTCNTQLRSGDGTIYFPLVHNGIQLPQNAVVKKINILYVGSQADIMFRTWAQFGSYSTARCWDSPINCPATYESNWFSTLGWLPLYNNFHDLTVDIQHNQTYQPYNSYTFGFLLKSPSPQTQSINLDQFVFRVQYQGNPWLLSSTYLQQSNQRINSDSSTVLVNYSGDTSYTSETAQCTATIYHSISGSDVVSKTSLAPVAKILLDATKIRTDTFFNGSEYLGYGFTPTDSTFNAQDVELPFLQGATNTYPYEINCIEPVLTCQEWGCYQSGTNQVFNVQTHTPSEPNYINDSHLLDTTIEIGVCSSLDVFCRLSVWFPSLLRFMLVPDFSLSEGRMSNLQDTMMSRSPFGYIVILDTFELVATNSSTLPPRFSLPVHIGNFNQTYNFDLGSTEQSLFNYVRQFGGILIWGLLLTYIIKLIRRIL